MAKPSTNDKKITDSRFKSANYDPRFRNPKLGKMKVKLDERFSKEQVEDSRKKILSVDEYGRNVKELKYLQKDRFGGDDFDKYFEKEDELESGEKEDELESEEKQDDLDLEEKVDDLYLKEKNEKDEMVIKNLDRARGEGVSDEESSSDSDSDASGSEYEVESEEELVIEEENPDVGDPTSRLALVNMDWDNIKAVDILATLASFCRKGTSSTKRGGKNAIGIKSVTIYPSEFGKTKMAKEELEGPSRDLFVAEKKKNKEYETSDSESEDLDDIDLKSKYDYEKNQQRAIKALYRDNQDDGNVEDYNSKSLRKYQLQRLRYYYAIIACDSVGSAESIYQNCDGLEFEATANFFDLRYVPDDTDFPEYVPADINPDIHDYCDTIPANYKPKIDYQTTALQHSKVKLTWDETPSDRMQFASKAFSSKDIEEMDFKAYLASDSDGEAAEDEKQKDTEENSLKQKYKLLLSSSTKIGDRNLFDAKLDDDSDADMEITFTPGLTTSVDGNEPADHEIEESSIDKYKRKAKERRKQRKEQLKESKKNNNVKNKNSSDGKTNAVVDRDLEKIVDSRKENDDEQHFDLKQIMKQEKESKKKRKNKNRNIDDEYLQEDFNPDLEDERFKGIFEDNAFNIDPNMPEFKKTSTMMKILEERNKRLENHEENGSPSRKLKKKRKHDDDSLNNGNASAKKLADKIKSKYKKNKKSKN